MSSYISSPKKKLTAPGFTAMKARGEKIAMLTAYDYTTALLIDSAGVDSILIGDSASNVCAGNATTLPQTLDEMIYHARSVARAVQQAFVVCDMPFGSYQISPEEGVRSAVRIMKETGVDALKIEGGKEYAETIRRIIAAGIPVVGHLGLTPQSVNVFGGYGLRAKEEREKEILLSDARLLEEVGCCGLVVEKIPAAVAKRVAEELSIPVIGIGAGPGCDGQVLVSADMLGMSEGFRPKFLRLYANLADTIRKAVASYTEDVKSGNFPSAEESY